MGTISTSEGLEGIFDLVDQNLQVIRQETNIWSLTILYLFVKFVYNCAITCNCANKMQIKVFFHSHTLFEEYLSNKRDVYHLINFKSKQL